MRWILFPWNFFKAYRYGRAYERATGKRFKDM